LRRYFLLWKCSRQDFCYVLKQAKVPLTQAQAEQLADSLAVDDRPDCLNYSQLAVAVNRYSEIRLSRKQRVNAEVDGQSCVTVTMSQWSSSLMSGAGSDTAQSVCQEVTGSEKALSAMLVNSSYAYELWEL